jgi:hypothetical protein
MMDLVEKVFFTIYLETIDERLMECFDEHDELSVVAVRRLRRCTGAPCSPVRSPPPTSQRTGPTGSAWPRRSCSPMGL